MTLKIERISGERRTRIRLSGAFRSENCDQVKAEIERGGPRIALDLEEVDLVDVEGVRFLNACKAEGILVLRCSLYIREWMLREQGRPKAPRTRKDQIGRTKTMSNFTHETVPTQFVQTNDIRYAYRRFGKPGTIPLLFLEYFNSNMDGWDPDVTDSFAAGHEVILFDNAGVGASVGKTPHVVAEMTKHCVAFCRALGLKQIHVVGFSLGGMIAQQLALEHPQLVGRLILLGTGPRGGEGMTFTELSPEEQADPVAFLLAAFFSPSEASQAAGREYMKRLASRKNDLDLPVSRDSAVAQVAALREWGTIPATGRYATLESITHPTLIVHGSKDIVVTPINAFILAEHLPNAQLIMYPDASHAAFSQCAENFLQNARLFLNE
jgi:pimeloyl-ACP methyl ester carboxylesterase